MVGGGLKSQRKQIRYINALSRDDLYGIVTGQAHTQGKRIVIICPEKVHVVS